VRRPQHGARRFIAILFFTLTPVLPASALYQEYQLAGSVAAAPGYSFATAQYRLYSNAALLKKDFLAFEYDLDSLYGDYAYGISQYFRAGAAAKAHVFDYQNLNHIVDPATGAETKLVSLNAPFYKGQLYAEARYKAWGVRYAAGAQKYDLSKRETSNTALTVASPGVAFVHTASLGYWQLSAPRSYAYTGVAAYFSVEAQQLSAPYVWQSSGIPVSVSREQFTVHELQLRAGEEFGGGALYLMAAARAGATSFALPGETQDVIQSFSVGGPESRYRRLAGYSFSEFRVPAYGLVNLDAIVRLAGPVNFWLIADAAIFDREYNARRLHAGAGAGLIIDLPDNTLGSRSAVFVRAEMPFFAAGGNRFQVFMGLNGQVF
jgi:hypothetical protein